MDIKHVQAGIALEDRLYVHVLLSIANGKCKNPAKLASAALKSSELDFPRWCA